MFFEKTFSSAKKTSKTALKNTKKQTIIPKDVDPNL